VAAQELGAERPLIDAFIRQEMEAGNIPGLAVGIVRGDRVVYLEGFGTAGPGRGEVTPQTPFVLGSVSKSITGLAVMQLAERGLLRLDDPVQNLLPWFAMGGPDAASIRIVHLLNHTSGIPAWHGHDSGIERGGSLEERVRLKHVPRLHGAPGTRFEYSSLNYDVLGLVIEAVTGRTYQEYVETEIFRPLDMTRSTASLREAADAGLAVGYRPWFRFLQPTAIDYPPSAAPSGYVASTAEDMTRFLIAFLDGGRYRERSVLSEAGIAAAQEAIGPAASGAGWFSGSYYKWHTGELANYNAYITTVPSHGLGIVTLANTNDIGMKFLRTRPPRRCGGSPRASGRCSWAARCPTRPRWVPRRRSDW
jgi:CubicO group peptidase (beta-lactamase class C family)